MIVGTFAETEGGGRPKNLAGKTVITSAVDDERLAFFKPAQGQPGHRRQPKLFDRVVGINVIEAMILAQTGQAAEDGVRRRLQEILRTSWTSSRACSIPRGRFRNIRRFAFVVHPLSQNSSQGLPIPKGTPKFIMDRRRRGRAHAADGVLQDGEHRLAHRRPRPKAG